MSGYYGQQPTPEQASEYERKWLRDLAAKDNGKPTPTDPWDLGLFNVLCVAIIIGWLLTLV